MRKFVWFAAWSGVGVWTLTAWAAYAMLALGTQVITGGADLAPLPPGSFTTGDPPLLEPLFPLFALIRNFGLAATVLVWGSVAAAILGAAWIVTRFLPAPKVRGTYTGTTVIEPPRRVPTVGTRGPDHAARARDLVDRFARRRR